MDLELAIVIALVVIILASIWGGGTVDVRIKNWFHIKTGPAMRAVRGLGKRG